MRPPDGPSPGGGPPLVRPPAPRQVLLAAEQVGAAAEALTARARVARVALQAGEGGVVVLAGLLGVRPSRPALAVAGASLEAPGPGTGLWGRLAMDLGELADLVDEGGWAIAHLLPQPVLEALDGLARAARGSDPGSAWAVERAGREVLGAWRWAPRDKVYHAAILGQCSTRAALTLALLLQSVEAPRLPRRAWGVSLAACGVGEVHQTARFNREEACALLLTDGTLPSAVPFCLARIQASAAALEVVDTWPLAAAWAELASIRPEDPSAGALRAVAQSIQAVEASAGEALGGPGPGLHLLPGTSAPAAVSQ